MHTSHPKNHPRTSYYNVPTFRSFFDDFFTKESEAELTFSPKVDIAETTAAYELNVILPGIAKEDISVEVKENTLIISGERKRAEENDDRNFRRVESRYGSFSRSFKLPKNVKADGINAEFNNGILEVVIPKDEKAEIVKKIDIK